jgi:hypothetical protein
MTNFWAEKLGVRNSPSPTATQPVVAWWSTSEPQPPSTVPYETTIVPQTYQVRPAENASTRGSSCPECGSGNYMQPARNVAHRCFDCNYPMRQEFTGQAAGNGTPHGKPVRQVTGSGWHPETIIGRLG